MQAFDIDIYTMTKLLDSTHRAVAVHQGALGFTAMVVTLNGPIHENVLPDLRWHASNP